MKRKDTDWIHDALDGAVKPPTNLPQSAQFQQYCESLDLLEKSRAPAPPDLAQRTLARLTQPPCHRSQRGFLKAWLPQPRQWLAPALAGAAITVAIIAVLTRLQTSTSEAGLMTKVSFELYAPDAQKVELVGTFNRWQPGTIRLQGPDSTGHWRTVLKLPHGRHEYLFLVDGTRWVTDPAADVIRPDGFGKMNAVLLVASEEPTL